MFLVYPPHAISDFFQRGHFQPLSVFDGLDKVRCLVQRFMRTGIEPSETSSHQLYAKSLRLEKDLIHRGYFQFSPCRWFHLLGNLHDPIRVKIKTDHGIVGTRLYRFLLDTNRPSAFVELDYTVTFGIPHPVTEHRRHSFIGIGNGLSQHAGKALPVKDVVAQHQAHGVVPHKLLPDDKRLRQSIGRWLLGILETHAELSAVSQQSLESGQIGRSADNKYLTNTRQHQYRYGVINHRFVIHRKHLLRYSPSNGIQSRAGASGQYYAFHRSYLIRAINDCHTFVRNISGNRH